MGARNFCRPDLLPFGELRLGLTQMIHVWINHLTLKPMGCLNQSDIKCHSHTWYTAHIIAPLLWRWGRIWEEPTVVWFRSEWIKDWQSELDVPGCPANQETKGSSMSFYPDFILILSWFYPDFIYILSWFYPDFIQILSRFYPYFILILSRFFENSLYPNFILILS